MSERKPKLLLLDAGLKEPVVELGRITYKSSGISVYLPRSIANALRLSKEDDSSLVIFSVGDYGFFLMKDKVLANSLKPQILDLRKRTISEIFKV